MESYEGAGKKIFIFQNADWLESPQDSARRKWLLRTGIALCFCQTFSYQRPSMNNSCEEKRHKAMTKPLNQQILTCQNP